MFLPKVVDPSGQPWFVDSVVPPLSPSTPIGSQKCLMDAGKIVPHLRHFKQANFAFVDGHVAPCNSSYIYTDLSVGNYSFMCLLPPTTNSNGW